MPCQLQEQKSQISEARERVLLEEHKLQSKHRPLRNTAFSGLAILLAFLILFLISAPFEYGAEQARPVLAVAGLLIVAAVIAFVGLGFALRVPQSQHKKLLTIVFGLAISIRLVAIFTTPVLEIDYYRYIWDGKVVCEGVSPYRFSPTQVLEPENSLGQQLNRLGELSTRSPSNHTILSRIHYEDFTTVYPPVSQFVFAAAMKLTPDSASVEAHVIAVKTAMTLFDLGTLLLICGLLKMARIHLGWLIAYAWNPLVIKEIANSGHLDSIATFFVVLTVCLVVRQRLLPSARFSKSLLVLAGISLGLGVGAKLFPVVVFPALLVAIVGKKVHGNDNQTRKRMFAGAIFSVAFALTSCFVLLPLIYKFSDNGDGQTISTQSAGESAVEGNSKAAVKEPEPTKNRDGFGGFFSSWRMNDPIFSTIYYNLKSDTKDSRQPWFVVTSKSWRIHLDEQFRSIGFAGKDPAYSMARILTLSLFSFFYLWHLVKLHNTKQGDGEWVVDLAQRITLVLALFLFLQPTVNPWYFVWVAPLTCLTNNKRWLLVSGLLTLYYSRFWFKSLTGMYTLGGTDFDGVKLFDHCFVFVEFGLIIAVLVCFCCRKKLREPNDATTSAA